MRRGNGWLQLGPVLVSCFKRGDDAGSNLYSKAMIEVQVPRRVGYLPIGVIVTWDHVDIDRRLTLVGCSDDNRSE